jgi:hypothetical protein
MAKVVLVLGWAIATALWILAMTRWKQRTLHRLPAGSAVWFWLRVFGVPETETNRARLLVYGSALGIAMATIMTVVILAFGVS